MKEGRNTFVLARDKGFHAKAIQKLRQYRNQRYSRLLNHGAYRILDDIRQVVDEVLG